MAQGRGRGAKQFLNSKGPKKSHGHVKDLRRAATAGRAAQGLGSGGRSGGTKSAGGHGGSGGHPHGSGGRGGMRSGGAAAP